MTLVIHADSDEMEQFADNLKNVGSLLWKNAYYDGIGIEATALCF